MEKKSEKGSAPASEKLEASLSTLIMSLASAAAMYCGITPNPQTGQMQKDKELARLNIDFLVMLQQKTKGNLTEEEKNLINFVVNDLQMKFVALK